MEHQLKTRKECIKFLRGKGTKVAVQIGYGGRYVFAEKSDLIREILKRDDYGPTLIDYDGNDEYAFVEDNVLHFPVGVM